MSNRALDRGAQLVYLDVEFLLPIKQLPALRLLKRGDEVRALIALVADPAVGGRNDIWLFEVSRDAVTGSVTSGEVLVLLSVPGGVLPGFA